MQCVKHLIYQYTTYMYVQKKKHQQIIYFKRFSTGKPQIYLEKTEDIDGCLVFSAVIESIPSANHAQWKVKGSEDDDYKQVKSNADEYKDISNSLPQPVLVIKKKELLKNKSFRIEVENFVGKSVKDIRKN